MWVSHVSFLYLGKVCNILRSFMVVLFYCLIFKAKSKTDMVGFIFVHFYFSVVESMLKDN